MTRRTRSSSNFNPRTPVGCDHRRRAATDRPDDFNPRTPVGCDSHVLRIRKIRPISIHAPQWGATRVWSFRPYIGNISIHAPQWGATDGGLAIANPIPISIHAPQWGATSPYSRTANSPTDFNPRTPVGCDRHTAITPPARSLFQSTHPSGVRQALGIKNLPLKMISIHAPQWGATGRHVR